MARTAKTHRHANGEGGIRQHASGRWEARLAVVDAAGKLHRQSLYAATEREAKQRLRQLIAQRDAGIVAPDARETMARFLASWLEGVKPTLRPRPWKRYEEHIRLHLVPTLGRIPLARLSPVDVQQAINALLQMGLAPATVGRAHATLRAALKQAQRWQLIPSNPASLVTPPRVEQREMIALDADQVRRFLLATRGSGLEALWVLAVTTGLRQGEILALQWSEVDLEGGSVRVTGTLTRIDVGEPAAGRPKTQRVTAPPKSARSRRRVEIGSLALVALRDHKRRQAEQRLHAGTMWTERNLVFSGAAGGHLHPDQLNDELRALLAAAGLPRIRFHDLRHTAATLLLGRDVNPKKVSEMLGHSTVAITLDTYSHVLPTMHREAAEIMDDLLGVNDFDRGQPEGSSPVGGK
jgi:integrase